MITPFHFWWRLLLGFLCGAVPYYMGRREERRDLAISAVLICTLCGAFLGIDLAFVETIVFVIFILNGWKTIWAVASGLLMTVSYVGVPIAINGIVGQKPPAPTGEIEQVVAHPQHSEKSRLDANGAPMPVESSDQVLVFTRVKLHNQSKEPLFLYQVMANITLDDGIHSSYAATKSAYDRLFLAYPDLAPLHGAALSPETTIAPGQTVEGTIVSQFRLTKQQWDARKDLNFSFGFQYLPSLVLAPHAAVIDQ